MFIIKFEMQAYFFERGSCQPNQAQQKIMQTEKSNPSKRFNQLSICRPYPIETQSISRFIFATFHMVFFLFTLGSYILMVQDTTFLGISDLILQSYISSNGFFGLVFILALKTIIICCITVEIVSISSKRKYEILFSVAEKVKRHLRVLIEADYQLSSLLLLYRSQLGVINFIFSLLIVAFSIVFLENYNYLNDKYYVGSLRYMALLRLVLGCGSVINSISLFLIKNTTFFLCYHLIASIVLIYNYMLTGWIIYKDTFLRWSLFSFLVLYFTMSINLMIFHYSISNSVSFAIHICVTFVVIASSLYFRLKRIEDSVMNCDERIEEEVFVLFNLLEESHTEIYQRAIIAALLQKHSFIDCKNPKCFTYSLQLYDSKRHFFCKSNDFINERGTLLRFYLQCRYQTYLSSPLKNDSVIINYCELLYWRFKNIGQAMFWLEHLKKHQHYLSFSSLIKFNGLIEIVRTDSQKFSENLYNKQLDIQGLIHAEKTYKTIISNTNVALRERLDTWKMMKDMDIDLSQLRENAESIFERIASVAEMWKNISRYLKHSNIWKQQYLFFILYVKNQKIKSKHLQQFVAELQREVSLCELVGKSNGKFELKTLLSDETCTMHIYLHDSKALIKRVSNNFSRFTGYSNQEVIRAEMSLLLPSVSRAYHQQVIESLFSSGKFQEESTYKPKEVSIINKSGFIIPVFKIFKEYVTNDGELEYISFLKRIEGKECTILCDQYHEIVSFTQNIGEELQISAESMSCMKNLNLLSMMPGLLDMSIFSQKRSNPTQKPLCKEKMVKTQQLQVMFYYSKDNLQSYLSEYLYQLQSISKDNLDQYLKQIKILQQRMRENPRYFTCDITFNEINNPFCKYYEIKINQMKLKRSVKTCIEQTTQLKRQQEMGSRPAVPVDYGLFLERAPTSTSASSNIFIKQQANDAPQSNAYLRKLRCIWITFAIFLCAASNIKLTLIAEEISLIRQLSITTQTILKISCKSAALVNYYQSYLLKLEQQEHVWPLIEQTTATIEDLIRQARIRRIIFDPTINIKAEYSPLVVSEDINSSYDNIDIIYSMEAIFHSLVLETNLTTDNRYYRQMLAYFYPSFIQNVNSSKIHHHQFFQVYADEISMTYTLSFIVESFLFILLIFSSFRANYKFNQSMNEMMKIHCHFNPNDLKKIIGYYMVTLDLFLNIESNAESVVARISTKIVEQEESNYVHNMNKRAKNVTFGKKQIKRTIAYLTKTIIGVLLLLSFTFFTNIYVYSMIPPIAELENDGYNEFSLVPSRMIGANIVSTLELGLEKHIDPSLYAQVMDNIQILANIPFQTKAPHNTNFYQTVRDFYFTNVCRLNQHQIERRNLSLSECQKVSEMSLTRGLVAFTGLQYEQLKNIIQDFIDFSEQQVTEFYHSLQFVGIFVQRLISLWSMEYDNLCGAASFSIYALTISSNILIFTVTFFILFILLADLSRQYSFYRQFYHNMMPNYIITEEKTIRSKLVIISFL